MVELRNISKKYPGREEKANDNISLFLRKGEILCIAGENGAGKTTLMKILCGLEKPDTGEIIINGKNVNIKSALHANNLGIGMVHQHFMLFGEYTVAENVVMGIEPRKWGVFFDSRKANKITEKIINKNNFAINSAAKIKDLTLGQMQQAEICRVLHRNAEIIILDEPTSILTEQETGALFSTLKTLASDGKALVLITHKLKEIKQISDRLAVLCRGELVNICNSSEIDEYEIARMMMGSEYYDADSSNLRCSSGHLRNGVNKNTDPVIAFENVTVLRRGQKQPLLEGVSFSAGKGEILGFTGVGGNGLGVIEAVLGGFLHPASGKVFLKGKDISNYSTRALRREGFAYVPSDRIRVGCAQDASIEENIIINRRNELNSLWLNKKEMNNFYRMLINDYNIEKAKGSDRCAVLSGGNIQKLILAREIDWFKDYIVFSEPTWGLDIASSRFIMGKIEELRKNGAAIILISTNLDEVVSLADRIIVMYSGCIAGEFANTGESIRGVIGDCMQGLLVKQKVKNKKLGMRDEG